MYNRNFSNGASPRNSFRKPVFSRGGSRPHFQRRAPGKGESINVSKFINKTVETEVEEKFVPVHKFSDFQIGENLKQAIAKKGFINPTPIQDQAIPSVLQDRKSVV